MDSSESSDSEDDMIIKNKPLRPLTKRQYLGLWDNTPVVPARYLRRRKKKHANHDTSLGYYSPYGKCPQNDTMRDLLEDQDLFKSLEKLYESPEKAPKNFPAENEQRQEESSDDDEMPPLEPFDEEFNDEENDDVSNEPEQPDNVQPPAESQELQKESNKEVTPQVGEKPREKTPKVTTFLESIFKPSNQLLRSGARPKGPSQHVAVKILPPPARPAAPSGATMRHPFTPEQLQQRKQLSQQQNIVAPRPSNVDSRKVLDFDEVVDPFGRKPRLAHTPQNIPDAFRRKSKIARTPIDETKKRQDDESIQLLRSSPLSDSAGARAVCVFEAR